MTLLIFLICIIVPDGVGAITARKEDALGEKFMKMVKKQYRLIEDPLISGYVEKVGQRVVSAFPSQPFVYHFYVVDEDVYNAFAGPAAHIFINRGLLEAMRSEDDLAGILAHEITHVHCRHISDMIERSQKIGMVSMAGIMAGLLFGVGGATELASGVSFGAVAAGQTMALAYTREDEMQADQIGLKYLDRAGYSGSGLLHMLRQIRSRQWFDSRDVPTYLMTHPAVEQRIAYISCWIDEHEGVQKSNTVPTGDFARIRTRLTGLYGDETLALNQFNATLKDNPADSLAHYGLGLVHKRLGRYRDAVGHLRIALQKYPADPCMLRELGALYFFQGQYQDAITVLKSVDMFLENNDVNSQIIMSRSLLNLGRFREAEYTLRAIVEQQPRHISALYYLSESCAKQGKKGASHYYLGRHYAARRDVKNARFHLIRALELLSTDAAVRKDAEKRLNAIVQKSGKDTQLSDVTASGRRPRWR